MGACVRACVSARVRACEQACVCASSACLFVFVCVSFCASKSCLLTFNTYSQDKIKLKIGCCFVVVVVGGGGGAPFLLLLICFCFGVVYTESNTKVVQLSSGSCECPVGGRNEGDYWNMFDRKKFERQPEALICFFFSFFFFG